MSRLRSETESPNKKKFSLVIINYLIAPSCLLAGVLLGWQLKKVPVQPINPEDRTALRLEGYKFISPLLACDIKFTGNSQSLSALQQQIDRVIGDEKSAGNITQAAVYFRDLKTNAEINLNSNEKFFPASLKKVPVMMQYYKMAETDPNILLQKKVFMDNTDYNAGVAIPPRQSPRYGKEYSTQELIEMMIKYSDNSSFQALFHSMGEKNYNKIYEDMQFRYPDNNLSIDDYITPYQLSLFFRTLYNATYLNSKYSEKALKLLSEVDYKNALVAGVPSGTTIAHKFGTGTVEQLGAPALGELHDCGIVYHPQNPYILCVMTKSQSLDIKRVEKVISNISSEAYKSASSNYR